MALSKTMEMTFLIGGALTSAFMQATSASTKKLGRLAEESEKLKKKFAPLEKFSLGEERLRKYSGLFVEARQKASDLHAQLLDGSKRSEAQQARLMESHVRATEKAERLRRKVVDLGKSHGENAREMIRSHGTVGALKRKQDDLRVSAERLEAVNQRAIKLEKRKNELQQRQVAARGEMMDALALAYVARKPVNAFIEGEQAKFRLGTVINTKDQYKKEAVRKADLEAQAVARTGLTGLNDARNIQYALNSAGLEASIARSVTSVVSSVSKLTGGAEEEVGEVLATAYNNLGKQIQGTAEEKFARFADLATKTQYKFQIRNFGQLGESLKTASPAISTFNVQVEQAYTTIGALNSAGLQGSMGGTAFNAMMRQLSKGCKEYKPQIVRAKDGTMDLIGTLRLIKKDMRFMNTDQQANFLQTLFGDEGMKGVVPLLRDLDELEKANKDVAEGSKGIVAEGTAEYLKTTKAKIDAMRASTAILAEALGGALAPAIQYGSDKIAKLADIVSRFTDKYPEIAKMTGWFLTGVVGMKIMGSGAKYLFGIFHGGLLNTISLLQRVSGFGSKAVMSLVKFAVANPVLAAIIVAIAAIAAAAWWVYKNWDMLKKWWEVFSKDFPVLAEIIKAAVMIIVTPVMVLWEAFKLAYEWGRKLLGLDTKTVQKVEYEIRGHSGRGRDPDAHDTGPAAAPSRRTGPGGGSRGGGTRQTRRKMATGGFVTSPTHALIGEAGDELVLPLGDRMRTSSLLNQAGIDVQAGNAIAPTVNVTNNVTIQGNADEQSVYRALSRNKFDLERMLERIANDRRRVSLA